MRLSWALNLPRELGESFVTHYWVYRQLLSIILSMKKITVQSFLQESFSNYRQSHALPLYQIKAAEQLMKCRTSALGGHALYCEDGHLNGVWYNSCKHRSCPQCSGLKAAQWQYKAESLLLKCKHHH